MTATGMLLLAIGALIGGWLGASFAATAARREHRNMTEAFSSPGRSIEVDCRACGQFNRVPHERVTDRPKCGRCKERLLPGRRVVLCITSPMPRDLRDDLNVVWDDADAFWRRIADHEMPTTASREVN